MNVFYDSFTPSGDLVANQEVDRIALETRTCTEEDLEKFFEVPQALK